jgi:hypothetical protein
VSEFDCKTENVTSRFSVTSSKFSADPTGNNTRPLYFLDFHFFSSKRSIGRVGKIMSVGTLGVSVRFY